MASTADVDSTVSLPTLPQLLSALSFPLSDDVSLDPLLPLYALHCSTSSSFAFDDLFSSLPPSSLPSLLSSLQLKLSTLLANGYHTLPSHPSHLPSLTLLSALTDLLTCLLSPTPSPLLLSSLALLHDSLLSFPHPSAQATQRRVAALLSAAFALHPHLPLLPLLLPYLLLSTLSSPTPPPSHLSSLSSLSSHLPSFDFSDPSSSQLTALLARAAIHPPFLRSPHGRRFLSTALSSLPPPTTSTLHLSIRSQLPGSRPSLLTHYGHVYHQAWRAAQGQCRLGLESALQELMRLTLHVSSPKTHRALLRLLHAVHSHRGQRETEELVARLWEPLLFRALASPHPTVRTQALAALLSAFPLLSLDLAVTQEAHLTTQLGYVVDGLRDAALGCRVVAVKGLASLVGQYWELLAASADDLIRAILRQAEDTAPAARIAVCEAASTLLACHQAHPRLKVLLPALAGLLHDRSPRVQTAFLATLHRIKGLRDLHYHTITPLAELLRALQYAGTEGVRRGVVRLLFNSFFPAGVEADVLVARARVMVEANGKAARAFYAGVKGDEAADERVQLAQGLFQVLHRAAGEADKENGRGGEARGRKAKGGKRVKGDGKVGWELDVGDVGRVEDVAVIAAAVWANLPTELDSPAYTRALDWLKSSWAGVVSALSPLSPLVHSCLLSVLSREGVAAEVGAEVVGSQPSLAGLAKLGAASPVPLLHCLLTQGQSEPLLDHLAAAVEGTGELSRATGLRLVGQLFASDRTRVALMREEVAVDRDDPSQTSTLRLSPAFHRLLTALQAGVEGWEAAVEAGEEVDVEGLEVWLKTAMHMHEEWRVRGEAEEEDGWDMEVDAFPAAVVAFLPALTSSLFTLVSTADDSPATPEASPVAKRARGAGPVLPALLVVGVAVCRDLLAMGYPPVSPTLSLSASLHSWLTTLSSSPAAPLAAGDPLLPSLYAAFFHLTAAVVSADGFDPVAWSTSTDGGSVPYAEFADIYRLLVASSPSPLPDACVAAVRGAVKECGGGAGDNPLLTLAVFLAPFLPRETPAVEVAVEMWVEVRGGGGGGVWRQLVEQSVGSGMETEVWAVVEEMVAGLRRRLDGVGEQGRRRGWAVVRAEVEALQAVEGEEGEEAVEKRRALQRQVDVQWKEWSGGVEQRGEETAVTE